MAKNTKNPIPAQARNAWKDCSDCYVLNTLCRTCAVNIPGWSDDRRVISRGLPYGKGALVQPDCCAACWNGEVTCPAYRRRLQEHNEREDRKIFRKETRDLESQRILDRERHLAFIKEEGKNRELAILARVAQDTVWEPSPATGVYGDSWATRRQRPSFVPLAPVATKTGKNLRKKSRKGFFPGIGDGRMVKPLSEDDEVALDAAYKASLELRTTSRKVCESPLHGKAHAACICRETFREPRPKKKRAVHAKASSGWSEEAEGCHLLQGGRWIAPFEGNPTGLRSKFNEIVWLFNSPAKIVRKTVRLTYGPDGSYLGAREVQRTRRSSEGQMAKRGQRKSCDSPCPSEGSSHKRCYYCSTRNGFTPRTIMGPNGVFYFCSDSCVRSEISRGHLSPSSDAYKCEKENCHTHGDKLLRPRRGDSQKSNNKKVHSLNGNIMSRFHPPFRQEVETRLALLPREPELAYIAYCSLVKAGTRVDRTVPTLSLGSDATESIDLGFCYKRLLPEHEANDQLPPWISLRSLVVLSCLSNLAFGHDIDEITERMVLRQVGGTRHYHVSEIESGGRPFTEWFNECKYTWSEADCRVGGVNGAGGYFGHNRSSPTCRKYSREIAEEDPWAGQKECLPCKGKSRASPKSWAEPNKVDDWERDDGADEVFGRANRCPCGADLPGKALSRGACSDCTTRVKQDINQFKYRFDGETNLRNILEAYYSFESGLAIYNGNGNAKGKTTTSAKPTPRVVPGSAPVTCRDCTGAPKRGCDGYCRRCFDAIENAKADNEPESPSPDISKCATCPAMVDEGVYQCKACWKPLEYEIVKVSEEPSIGICNSRKCTRHDEHDCSFDAATARLSEDHEPSPELPWDEITVYGKTIKLIGVKVPVNSLATRFEQTRTWFDDQKGEHRFSPSFKVSDLLQDNEGTPITIANSLKEYTRYQTICANSAVEIAERKVRQLLKRLSNENDGAKRRKIEKEIDASEGVLKLWEQIRTTQPKNRNKSSPFKITVTARAAAGKSHLGRSLAKPGTLVIVPTRDQKAEWSSKMSELTFPVTVDTPDKAFLRYYKGELFNQVIVDEAWLLHAGLHEMAVRMSTIRTVIMGHKEQVRWGARLDRPADLRALGQVQYSRASFEPDFSLTMAGNWRSSGLIVHTLGKAFKQPQYPMRPDAFTTSTSVEISDDFRPPGFDKYLSTNNDMVDKNLSDTTIHKVQGNEWDSVHCIAQSNSYEMVLTPEFTNYDYTLFSRARNRVSMKFTSVYKPAQTRAIRQALTSYNGETSFKDVSVVSYKHGNSKWTNLLKSDLVATVEKPVPAPVGPSPQSAKPSIERVDGATTSLKQVTVALPNVVVAFKNQKTTKNPEPFPSDLVTRLYSVPVNGETKTVGSAWEIHTRCWDNADLYVRAWVDEVNSSNLRILANAQRLRNTFKKRQSSRTGCKALGMDPVPFVEHFTLTGYLNERKSEEGGSAQDPPMVVENLPDFFDSEGFSYDYFSYENGYIPFVFDNEFLYGPTREIFQGYWVGTDLIDSGHHDALCGKEHELQKSSYWRGVQGTFRVCDLDDKSPQRATIPVKRKLRIAKTPKRVLKTQEERGWEYEPLKLPRKCGRKKPKSKFTNTRIDTASHVHNKSTFTLEFGSFTAVIRKRQRRMASHGGCKYWRPRTAYTWARTQKTQRPSSLVKLTKMPGKPGASTLYDPLFSKRCMRQRPWFDRLNHKDILLGGDIERNPGPYPRLSTYVTPTGIGGNDAWGWSKANRAGWERLSSEALEGKRMYDQLVVDLTKKDQEIQRLNREIASARSQGNARLLCGHSHRDFGHHNVCTKFLDSEPIGDEEIVEISSEPLRPNRLVFHYGALTKQLQGIEIVTPVGTVLVKSLTTISKSFLEPMVQSYLSYWHSYTDDQKDLYNSKVLDRIYPSRQVAETWDYCRWCTTFLSAEEYLRCPTCGMSLDHPTIPGFMIERGGLFMVDVHKLAKFFASITLNPDTPAFTDEILESLRDSYTEKTSHSSGLISSFGTSNLQDISRIGRFGLNLSALLIETPVLFSCALCRAFGNSATFVCPNGHQNRLIDGKIREGAAIYDAHQQVSLRLSPMTHAFTHGVTKWSTAVVRITHIGASIRSICGHQSETFEPYDYPVVNPRRCIYTDVQAGNQVWVRDPDGNVATYNRVLKASADTERLSRKKWLDHAFMKENPGRKLPHDLYDVVMKEISFISRFESFKWLKEPMVWVDSRAGGAHVAIGTFNNVAVCMLSPYSGLRYRQLPNVRLEDVSLPWPVWIPSPCLAAAPDNPCRYRNRTNADEFFVDRNHRLGARWHSLAKSNKRPTNVRLDLLTSKHGQCAMCSFKASSLPLDKGLFVTGRGLLCGTCIECDDFELKYVSATELRSVYEKRGYLTPGSIRETEAFERMWPRCATEEKHPATARSEIDTDASGKEETTATSVSHDRPKVLPMTPELIREKAKWFSRNGNVLQLYPGEHEAHGALVMGCCNQHDIHDVIVAEGQDYWRTVNIKSHFNHFSWVSKSHSLDIILPFDSMRGVPWSATLPKHAHGVDYQTPIQSGVKPLEILVAANQPFIIDPEVLKWSYEINNRSTTFGHSGGPLPSGCTSCKRPLWRVPGDTLCNSCLSIWLIPQIPARLSPFARELMEKHYRHVKRWKSFIPYREKFPKLAITGPRINALVVWHDGGKTLLEKMYPEVFVTMTHSLAGGGGETSVGFLTYLAQKIDLSKKILLISMTSAINYPLIRVCGAVGLKRKPIKSHHNVDWQLETELIRSLDVPMYVAQNGVELALYAAFISKEILGIDITPHSQYVGECGRPSGVPTGKDFPALASCCDGEGYVVPGIKNSSTAINVLSLDHTIPVKIKFPFRLAAQPAHPCHFVFNHEVVQHRVDPTDLGGTLIEELMEEKQTPVSVVWPLPTRVLDTALNVVDYATKRITNNLLYYLLVSLLWLCPIVCAYSYMGNVSLVPLPKVDFEPLQRMGATVHYNPTIVIEQGLLSQLSHICASAVVSVIGSLAQTVPLFWGCSIFTLIRFSVLVLAGSVIYQLVKIIGLPTPIPSLREWDVRGKVDCQIITEDFPDIDRNRLLFVALGTRGDILPVAYLARVLAKHGIPTAFRVIKSDGPQDLRDVANGTHWSHIPYFLHMQMLTMAKWKWVYASQINSAGVTNIALGPSRRYVGPFNVKNTVLGILTKLLMRTVIVDFSIGSLRDSDIGRSADGATLLRRRENKPIHEWGYTFGSDALLEDDPRIAKLIAEKGMVRITGTNHSEEFTKYQNVLCHGGAGTMQTIIASGAVAWNADNSLDRDYIRELTPLDWKQTTPLPLVVHGYYKYGKRIPINWLISAAPMLVRSFGPRMVLSGLYYGLQVMAVPYILFGLLPKVVLLLITIRPYVNFGLPSIAPYVLPIAKIIFDFPFILTNFWFSPLLVLFASIYYGYPLLMNDITALTGLGDKRYKIQFSYVNIGKNHELPGHISIYDTASSTRYEGKFRDKVGIFESFRWSRQENASPRPDRLSFELPFNMDPQQFIYNEDLGRYSVFFNCQTLVAWRVLGWHLLLYAPVLIAVFIGWFLISGWMVGNSFKRYAAELFGITGEVNRSAPPLFGVEDTPEEAHNPLPADIPYAALSTMKDEAVESIVEYKHGYDRVVGSIKELVTDQLVPWVSSLDLPDVPLFGTTDQPIPANNKPDRGRGNAELRTARVQKKKAKAPQRSPPVAAPPEETVPYEPGNIPNASVPLKELQDLIPTEEAQVREWLDHQIRACPSDSSTLEQRVAELLLLSTNSAHTVYLSGGTFTAPLTTLLTVEQVKEMEYEGTILPALTQDDYNHAMLMAIYDYLKATTPHAFEKFPIVPKSIGPREMHGQAMRETYVRIVNTIHDLLKPLYSTIPQVEEFVKVLRQSFSKLFTLVLNFLRLAREIAMKLYDFSFNTWKRFFEMMSELIDMVWEPEYATRIKSVWAASTIFKQKSLSMRARIASEIEFMSNTKRGNPVEDISNLTKGLETDYFNTHGVRPKLLAILSPPNSGKSTFATGRPNCVDIDTLVDENALTTHRKNQSWGEIDRIYREAVTANLQRFHDNGDLLFAHNVGQLPDVFLPVAVLCEENPHNDKHMIGQMSRDTFMLHRRKYHDSFIVPTLAETQQLYQRLLDDYQKGGIMYQGLHRNINIGRPVMTKMEAEMFGFEDYERTIDPEFEERVANYRRLGAMQGGDGVTYSVKHPEVLRTSIDRYSPRHLDVDSDEAALNWEIAKALVDQYPEAFVDSKLTPPESIKFFLEKKMAYSAGAPFMTIARKRQELYNAGWDEVLCNRARQALIDGKYPKSIYHGFGKSQVTYKPHQPRTVVAQSLDSYYVDQVIQLQRNHRIHWRTTGVGTGMILNQNMQGIFESLEDFKNTGGLYFEADAHQYDSTNRPGTFDCLAKMSYYSFKKPVTLLTQPDNTLACKIQSVMEANYKDMQDSYVFGITEHQWQGLTIGVPSEQIIDILVATGGRQFVRSTPTLDTTTLPQGTIVLTTSHHRTPDKLRFPFFAHVMEEAPLEHEYPIIETKSTGISIVDQVREIQQNYRVMYNLHFKNRGGGTGQSATSWDNTWGYRSSYIKGWIRFWKMKGVHKSPKDFFIENDLKNTGDDCLWSIKIKKKDMDEDLFVRCMAHYGVTLELQGKDKIEDLQYLGNRVLRISSSPVQKSWYEDWKRIKVFGGKPANVNRIDQRQQSHFLDTGTQPHNPRFLVYHDTSQTLLRRTAFRYYQASPADKKYIRTSIQRGIGQAQLTAWDPDLYLLMAKEYIEDMTRLGHYCGVRIIGNVEKQKWDGAKHPWWMVKLYSSDEYHAKCRGEQYHAPSSYSKGAHPSKAMLKAFVKSRGGLVNDLPKNFHQMRKSEQAQYFWVYLKTNAFPSYYQVVTNQMRLSEATPDKYDKFVEKFFTVSGYGDERIRETLNWLSSVSANHPRELYGMWRPIDRTIADPVWYTRKQYCENFIYQSAKARKGSDPTYSEFIDLCNQSPYSGVMWPEVFWHNMSNPDYLAEEASHPLYVYKNMTWFITLMYLVLFRFEQFILSVPWLGLLLRLWLATKIDIPRFYSYANLAYFHAHGKSSPVISSLIPRDPYNYAKVFVAFVVDAFFPLWLGYVFRFDLLLDPLPDAFVFITEVLKRNQAMKITPQDKAKESKFVNPWDAVVLKDKEFRDQWAEPDSVMLLTAGTGVGKSTMLQASLDITGYAGAPTLPGDEPIDRQVILVPRQILRDEWSSPLMDKNSFETRQKSFKITRATGDIGHILEMKHTVLVMTYGHFINRPELHKDTVKRNTVYHFDEFHEMSDEMKVAYERLTASQHLGKILFLSATKVSVPWVGRQTFFKAPIKQRFSKELVIVENFPRNPADVYLKQAKQLYADHAKPENTIIRVVTIKQVTDVMEVLALNQIQCQEVSRRTRGEPLDPAKLLVCTQIIDAGINIPKRRLLIDNGYERKEIRGQSEYGPSCPNTAKQLMGRVGRFQNGDIVMRPSFAGTGKLPDPYGNPALYTSELVASSHGVHPLASMTSPLLWTLKTHGYIHILKDKVPDEHLATSCLAYVVLRDQLSDKDKTPQEWKRLCDYRTAVGKKPKVPEDLEFVYMSLQNIGITLLEDSHIIRETISRPGVLAYSMQYKQGRPLPEIAPFNYKMEFTSWDKIANNQIVFLFLNNLKLKERKWIEDEGINIHREIITVVDIDKKMLDTQLAKLKSLNLPPDLNDTVERRIKAYSELAIQNPLTYTKSSTTAIPLVVQQGTICLLCTQVTCHKHRMNNARKSPLHSFLPSLRDDVVDFVFDSPYDDWVDKFDLAFFSQSKNPSASADSLGSHKEDKNTVKSDKSKGKTKDDKLKNKKTENEKSDAGLSEKAKGKRPEGAKDDDNEAKRSAEVDRDSTCPRFMPCCPTCKALRGMNHKPNCNKRNARYVWYSCLGCRHRNSHNPGHKVRVRQLIAKDIVRAGKRGPSGSSTRAT